MPLLNFFRQKPKSWLAEKAPALRLLKIFFAGIFLVLACLVASTELLAEKYNSAVADVKVATTATPVVAPVTPPVLLDTAAYDKKIMALANRPAPIVVTPSTPPTPPKTTGATTKVTPGPTPPAVPAKVIVPPPQLWPASTVYPNGGAILPFKRIVAYYGNFYSKGMGALGQYPPAEMLERLQAEAQKWELADPTTPVVPAIDYIAVTAQGTPSIGGKYRLRMPDSQLDLAVALADQIHGIVFLEIQPGTSTFQTEIPQLEKYLKMPEVHLSLDPEFSMKTGARPGTVIGSIDADDINFAANYLASLVKANNLPPKILVVHRFTEDMVTHYKLIKPLPEVQIIMDMDGWGSQAKKIGTYNSVIYREPVQFTGFKLFYKNDLRAPSTGMLTPDAILKLQPQPIFIQYQ